MFKNVKKALLFVVLVLVSVLAFACEECPECKEINEDSCKEFCPDTGECKEANKENCAEYCPEGEKCNEETCKDFIPSAEDLCKDYLTEEKCETFFPIIAPTSFEFDPALIELGETYEIEIEALEPEGENVYKGFYWYSSDETIATVDENGVVTPLRPGTIEITAKSIIDSSVEWAAEFSISDPIKVEYDLLAREENYLLSLIPTYATKSFTFPKAWNGNVEVEYVDDKGQAVDSFEMPTDITKDTQSVYTVNLKTGSTTRTFTAKVWACLDEEANVVTQLNAAVTTAETLIKDYINGELVASDLILPTTIYGTSLSWDSNLESVISSEGKYTRQNDDTPVSLTLVAKCGDNPLSKTYSLTAKGYTKEEKLAYILEEGSLARVAGKYTSTSIVLPNVDSKFKAALSYKSQNPEVIDDSGALVADVQKTTEVKFTLKVDYSFAKTYGFEAETEFTVYVSPKNDAAKAADKWLSESAYKEVVFFPYGTKDGNVLDVPVAYEYEGKTYQVKWDVTPSVVEPKYLTSADETTTTAFELNEEGKPELVTQFLRYTQVPLTATFVDGYTTATVSIVLSIGISNDPTAIYTGTWRNSDQMDGSLNERTGSLDTVVNASHFDKTVGYVQSSIGYGYWSGTQVKATYEGKNYEYFNLDYMYWEVAEDADGNLVKVAKSLWNNAGDMGGNWGWMMKNTTDHEIWIEVGTYAASGYNYVYDEKDDVAYVGENGNWFIRKDVKLDTGVKAEGTEGAYTNGPKVYNGYYMFATETGVEAIPSLDEEGNQVKDDDGNLVYTNTPVAKDGFYYIGETNTNIAVKEGSYAEIADGKWLIVYENTKQAYGKIAIPAYGDRTSWSFDGYALGFIADASGKVLYGSGTGKFEEILTLDDITTVGSAEAKYLVGGSTTKGTKVHYLVIPAGGYAMNWKYQYYGVGSPSAVYPFCQTGAQLEINQYGVHPLNSYKATTATTYLKNAEASITKGGTSNNKSIETNLLKARELYETELSEITKANVFPAERLEEAEKAYAKMLDAEITLLLLKENRELAEEEDPFVTQLGNMYTRLQALNTNITSYLTKKDAFDAKYDEYAKIDLTITLDYKGGYAEGLYAADDFDKVIPLLLNDLYDWMISQNAWEGETAPTRAEFTDPAYFGNNYAKNEITLLTKYLFTAKYDTSGELYENYHDVIEGTDKFFNSKEYHDKWIDMMDYVDEATRRANMAGQDAWGRKGEVSQAAVWSTEELTKYNGNTVTITNSGETLGAYRFAQYIAGSIANSVYKNKIPANKYSAIFDRQDTQEKYSRIVYHCTDGEIELPAAAHKDGYEFGGWYFDEECTEKAKITGAYFKDVTLYAKWNPATESAISKDLGKEVEGVYYGATEDTRYTKETPTGTVNDQVATVGLGKYGVVVGNKLFVLPKYSLIELGKDATEVTKYETKESLQVYGVDGTTENKAGLAIDTDSEGNEIVTVKNSFGHGALYLNAGTFDVEITEIKYTYGRDLGGEAYGYHRYVFSYDTEKDAYVGKNVGVSGALTLKPGEFLWCPMTAERFCTGLTDCDGTNGVKGVLSDGIEVQIIEMSNYTYEDIPWIGVQFISDGKYVSEQYFEGEATVVVPNLEKSGYDFVGWATTPEATKDDVVEVNLKPTESAIYYAVWEKAYRFNEITIDANYTGEDPQTFKSLADIANHVLEGAVVTIKAGTYEGNLEIDRKITIVGPNTNVNGANANRANEAIITGTFTIKENVAGVTIDGLKFAGTGKAIVLEAGANNTTIKNCVVAGTGTRGVYGTSDISNLVVENSLFDAPLVGAARFLFFEGNGVVTNATFENNTFKSEEKANAEIYLDAIRANNVAGIFNVVNNNFDGFYGDNFTIFFGSASNKCTEINVISNSFNGANENSSTIYLSGIAFRNAQATTKVNIKYNIFANVKGSAIDLKGGSPIVEIANNAFIDSAWSDFVGNGANATITINNNFFGGTAPEGAISAFESYEAWKGNKIALYGVQNIDEIYEELIKDFYAFLSEGKEEFESYETFKAGFDAAWAAGKKYNSYDDKLYSLKKKDVVDDTLDTFANSSKYATKWMPFFNSFDKDVVTDVNSAQSMWTSTYTGLMRIRDYFGKGTHVTDVRNAKLIAAMNEGLLENKRLVNEANLATTHTKVGEIVIECKDVSIWSGTYNATCVYLCTGRTTGAAWLGAYADVDSETGLAVITDYKSKDAPKVSSCDWSIVCWSGNAEDYAAIEGLGIKAGDIIAFGTTKPETIASGFCTYTVTIYRAK